MKSKPQLPCIWYVICVVCIRGQYLNCVLCSLLFFWCCVCRSYMPRVRVSITSFIGLCFVTNKTYSVYISYLLCDLGGRLHIFLWKRRSHHHFLYIFCCYPPWSPWFCYTLERNKHSHNDVVSVRAWPSSCKVALMKHASNIPCSLHDYDATMTSSLRKTSVMK